MNFLKKLTQESLKHFHFGLGSICMNGIFFQLQSQCFSVCSFRFAQFRGLEGHFRGLIDAVQGRKS